MPGPIVILSSREGRRRRAKDAESDRHDHGRLCMLKHCLITKLLFHSAAYIEEALALFPGFTPDAVRIFHNVRSPDVPPIPAQTAEYTDGWLRTTFRSQATLNETRNSLLRAAAQTPVSESVEGHARRMGTPRANATLRNVPRIFGMGFWNRSRPSAISYTECNNNWEIRQCSSMEGRP